MLELRGSLEIERYFVSFYSICFFLFIKAGSSIVTTYYDAYKTREFLTGHFLTVAGERFALRIGLKRVFKIFSAFTDDRL